MMFDDAQGRAFKDRLAKLGLAGEGKIPCVDVSGQDTDVIG
jgi:hypothetical protein